MTVQQNALNLIPIIQFDNVYSLKIKNPKVIPLVSKLTSLISDLFCFQYFHKRIITKLVKCCTFLIWENNLTKADHSLIKCNLINHVESYFVQTLTNS